MLLKQYQETCKRSLLFCDWIQLQVYGIVNSVHFNSVHPQETFGHKYKMQIQENNLETITNRLRRSRFSLVFKSMAAFASLTYQNNTTVMIFICRVNVHKTKLIFYSSTPKSKLLK